MRAALVPRLLPLACSAVESLSLVFLLIGVAVATQLPSDPRGLFDGGFILARVMLLVVIFQLCLYYNDTYESFVWQRRVVLFIRIGQSFGASVVILLLSYYVYPPLDLGRGILQLFLPLAFFSIVAWRFVFQWLAGYSTMSDRVLVLGTGASALHVAWEVFHRAPPGFKILGFLGEPQEVGHELFQRPVIGTTDDLLDVVKKHAVDVIVVALDELRGKMPMADLLKCRLAGVRVEEASSFFEKIAGNILVHNLRPSALVFASGFDRPRYIRNLKRASDLAIALALLLALAPLFALIAVLVKLTSPGPVFYKQDRVGERGLVFSLVKFRSMTVGAETKTGPTWATEGHDPRVTWLGRRLRRFRLDELPQLFNVLPGDMSFVGPRPERPHFVEMLRRLLPYYDERHNVKPGITGWAQIKLGYGSAIEDSERKLQFDLYYVKNMSFLLDFAIILDTVKVMLPAWAASYREEKRAWHPESSA